MPRKPNQHYNHPLKAFSEGIFLHDDGSNYYEALVQVGDTLRGLGYYETYDEALRSFVHALEDIKNGTFPEENANVHYKKIKKELDSIEELDIPPLRYTSDLELALASAKEMD